LATSVALECRLEHLSGLSFLYCLCHMLSVILLVWFLLPHPLGHILQLATFASSMSTAGIRTVFCRSYFIPLEVPVSKPSEKIPNEKTHPFSSIMLGGKIKNPVPFSVMAPPLHATGFVLLLSSRSRHSFRSLSVSNTLFVSPLSR
jgi:hypothetical protein